MTIQQTESYKLMRSFFYFNVYLLLRDCSLCRAVCARKLPCGAQYPAADAVAGRIQI